MLERDKNKAEGTWLGMLCLTWERYSAFSDITKGSPIEFPEAWRKFYPIELLQSSLRVSARHVDGKKQLWIVSGEPDHCVSDVSASLYLNVSQFSKRYEIRGYWFFTPP